MPDLPVQPIDRLLIIEALKRLKALYCRAVDTRDWAAFESVFAPDATLDFRGAATTSVNEGVLQGVSNIVRSIREAVAGMTTVHQCHTPEIEVISSGKAAGIWHMADLLRWPVGSPIRAKCGYGYYHETYVLIDGLWKIASTRLERILNEEVVLKA